MLQARKTLELLECRNIIYILYMEQVNNLLRMCGFETFKHKYKRIMSRPSTMMEILILSSKMKLPWRLKVLMDMRNITNSKLSAAKPLSLLQTKSNSSSSSFSNGSSRRRIYDGLLLDAGGTLLQLNEPVEQTYATITDKYGLRLNESEIKQGFKRAFKAPWPKKLRYQGDGRELWRLVFSEATGCSWGDYFEEVYEHYAHGDAWHLPDKAHEVLTLFNDAGVKMEVVSNFDNRLRKLLKDLDVASFFDAIIISSEVGYEKPAAGIFQSALDQIGVGADGAIHFGDDEEADKSGANALGIDCRLWGCVDIY